MSPSDALLLRHMRAFHAASGYASLPLNEPETLLFMRQLERSGDGFLAANEAGFIGGLLSPMWFSPQTKVAQELFWWSAVKGEGHKLRLAFEGWAKASGAHVISFSTLADRSELRMRTKMMEAGYRSAELSFWKAV